MPKLLIFDDLCCWFARKMSQFTRFCSVKFLAWKSGCVKFLTNSMSETVCKRGWFQFQKRGKCKSNTFLRIHILSALSRVSEHLNSISFCGIHSIYPFFYFSEFLFAFTIFRTSKSLFRIRLTKSLQTWSSMNLWRCKIKYKH